MWIWFIQCHVFLCKNCVLSLTPMMALPWPLGSCFEHTVKPCYLKLDGTEKNRWDIWGFETTRVKYLENKWLRFPNNFDISMVFEISMFVISVFEIIVFEISVFNCSLGFHKSFNFTSSVVVEDIFQTYHPISAIS